MKPTASGFFDQCLTAVRADDLRFGFPAAAGSSLKEALQDRTCAEAKSAAARLREALPRTFAEDVRDVAQVLASARYAAYPGSIKTAGRVVAQRFGAIPGGTEFSEIGVTMGRTKQRAQALFKSTLEPARSGSVFSPAVEAILAGLDRVVPAPVDRVDEQLRDVLGRSSSINVLEFIRAVQGKAAPFERKAIRQSDGEHVFYSVLHRVEVDADQLETVWRTGVSLCLATGATQLIRIAGVLQLEHGLTLTRDALVEMLRQQHSFRWLDERGDWLAMRDGRPSVLENRVAKIFAVSHGPFSLQRLIEILASDPILAQHADAGLPPGPILDRLLSGWTWLERSIGASYTRAQPIDPEKTLSEIERVIVTEIRKAGGTAPIAQIRTKAMAATGLTKEAVWKTMQTSVIVQRVGRATYGLIGPELRG